MLVRSSLLRRLQPPPLCPNQPILQRTFRQSAFLQASHMPDHYQTLELPTHATPTEVKKSFYRLSKSHHPDLHPNDPSKSKKFVAISEAYSVLGSPEKRQRYDRDFLPASAPESSGHAGHRGSYSSHSTPAGGRPASGLSKRRTQFKGPPPSFYRSGGWGAHSEKRGQYASHGPGETRDHPSAAGTGPGGFARGDDHDVPHFDQRGHFVRHEKIEKTRHRARRKVERTLDDLDYSGGGASPLFNFIMISGALAVIVSVSGLLLGGSPKSHSKKKDGEDG